MCSIYAHQQFINIDVWIRDEILKNQRNLLENNKIKANINYNKIKSISDIEEVAKLTVPIHKGATLPPKQFSTAGRIRPNDFSQGNTHSLPQINKSLPSHISNLLVGKARSKVNGKMRSSLNDSNEGSLSRINRSGSNLQSSSPSGNYYFNKQAMYKCKLKHLLLSLILSFLDRYDRQAVSVRPKKRIAYLPPIEAANKDGGDHLSDRGVRASYSQRRIAGGLNRSRDSSPRRRSGSLTDVSYMSTASSSSRKAKQRVVLEAHRVRQGVPEEMKEKALHPRAHIPMRYNESPYVLKLKTDKYKNSNGEAITDRLPQQASHHVRGKSVSPTPKSLQRDVSQKRGSKLK